MKRHELKNLSENDLMAQLKEVTALYQELSFQKSITPIENPLRLRNLRREIARINTLLGNKSTPTVEGK